jgi:hypothetical protein
MPVVDPTFTDVMPSQETAGLALGEELPVAFAGGGLEPWADPVGRLEQAVSKRRETTSQRCLTPLQRAQMGHRY